MHYKEILSPYVGLYFIQPNLQANGRFEAIYNDHDIVPNVDVSAIRGQMRVVAPLKSPIKSNNL